MANIPSFSQYLSESILSRLYRQNIEHDCGALTAWRKTDPHGVPYTRAEKDARNRSLRAKLVSKGYSITAIHGVYPEVNPKTGKEEPSKEESYFVVDIKNGGHLEHDLRELGALFDQDSILFIPRGAVEKKAQATLIGTNHTGWPGLGKRMPFERGRFGYTSPIYTSFVNGRPFIFESIGESYTYPATGFGVWALRLHAEQDWRAFLTT